MDLLNSAIEGFFEAFVYWSVSLLALIWSYCWNGQLDFSPLCVFKCLLALVAFLLLCVTPVLDMELLSKRPVGHTSRHWKAKAVAARANYLWKAELFKREPVRKGPQVQVELVHILGKKPSDKSHKISLNSKWGGVWVQRCWWLWGPEATVAWGKVQTRSDHGSEAYRRVPRPPRPPPTYQRTSRTRQL